MPRYSAAALAGLLVLAGCEGGSFRPTPTMPEAPVPDPGPVPNPEPVPNPNPRVHKVFVRDNYFDPQVLQINPGDTVHWVLKGTAGHWVTEPDFWAFRGYLEKRGDSLKYRFGDGTGGYIAYFLCDEHYEMGMLGCIRVGPDAPPCTHIASTGQLAVPKRRPI